MVTVEQETYEMIEADMEEWWNANHSHWDRMFKDGKRIGKSEFIKQHSLTISAQGDNLVVEIKNKNDKTVYISTYEVWYE